MFYTEVWQTLVLVKNNEIVRVFACLVVFLSVIVGVFYSVLGALAVFGSYILGLLTCWFITKYENNASFYLQRCASFYRVHVSPLKRPSALCPVCNKNSCTRHRVLNNANPWKDLYINEDLNEAVEHFYNRILDEFVNSWYKNFTNDDAFIGELRVCLRYGTARLINKILDFNFGRVIGTKAVPCAIKHVDDYLCMQQIAKLKNVCFQNVIVEYLGSRLHIATTNRRNELSYLRQLSICLLQELLPPSYLKCKNFVVLMQEIISAWVFLPLMDVISDPNTINLLVILITENSNYHIPSKTTRNVELLQNFLNKDIRQSSFSYHLKTVLKTTDLLYAFIQFLKREGPVNVLQFCLDVEEFNNKLLTPDMSKQQLQSLHTEALGLYKTYLDHHSADFIGCKTEIGNQLNVLLQEGVYNVAKLRTSEPLYQAYDFAFGTLENDWLPQFFHSKEFYNCICVSNPNNKRPSGTKSPMLFNRSPIKLRGRKYESSGQGTVAKISSGLLKMKGALKPNQPVEGAIYQADLLSTDSTFVEDIMLSDCENIFRDLSMWRISVIFAEALQVGQKNIFVFHIVVRRIDTGSEHMIQRKEQDFHVLKAKLIEFHGENEISDQIPSRRSSMPLETRRSKYEEFLHSLLQKPSLRGSDLLYTFLTTKQDFATIASVPVVEDLGNIYQSVAFKLRKEKGQHLDNFMNTFLSSTISTKQNKFEWEVGDEADILSFGDDNINLVPATYCNETFQNNFGVDLEDIGTTSSSSFNPEGITESLFYLMKHAFKVRESVLRLFAAICSIAQQAVESFIQHFIDRKIKSALCQPNLTYLTKLLEAAIFDDTSTPSKEDLEKRKIKAFSEVQRKVPQYLQKILGGDTRAGLCTLLEIMQHPQYNKQLAYYFLDIIVAELYPHLDMDNTEDC